MTIPFTKYHGIGNDYLFIEVFDDVVDGPAALARAMSDRHRGVGADGIILVGHPTTDGADVRMRIFNADGSEAEMCGNGIRCVCKLAYERGRATANPMHVETGAGVLAIEFRVNDDGSVDDVTVDMGPATFGSIDAPLATVDAAWARDLIALGVDTMTCVSTGNPHAVFFTEADPHALPLDVLGPIIERDAMFPGRTNVHVVRVDGADEVTMRTWERGSGLTQACGTGASGVVAAAARTGRTSDAALVHLPGGDLRIEWDRGGNRLFMTGPAEEVFSGHWIESSLHSTP